MERKPIDISRLPRNLHRYVAADAPAGMKMMAARGMLPLKPFDLAELMYNLCFDPDPAIAQAADKGFHGLPPAMVLSVVEQPLEPEVLDMIAEIWRGDAEIVQKVVLNQRTSDETVDLIAQTCDSKMIEVVAQNQVRYLRTPSIIRSVYENPFSRQDIVDFVLELARRNGLNVDRIIGIEHVEEPQKAPAPAPAAVEAKPDEKTPAMPAAPGQLPALAAEDEKIDFPPQYLEDKKEFTDAEGKAFVKWMTDAPEGELMKLARHCNAATAVLLAKTKVAAPALELMKNTRIETVHWGKIAGDRQANEDLIKIMCKTKDFTKIYNIKAKLALNPKTPISCSMGFVRGMRLSDLKNTARNKSAAMTLQNT
ncbi:MAG: hypothetical protein WC889_19465, partial [Myxococcota bacterium]